LGGKGKGESAVGSKQEKRRGRVSFLLLVAPGEKREKREAASTLTTLGGRREYSALLAVC